MRKSALAGENTIYIEYTCSPYSMQVSTRVGPNFTTWLDSLKVVHGFYMVPPVFIGYLAVSSSPHLAVYIAGASYNQASEKVS